MAGLRVCVTIDRPPQRVWRYLEQIERHPEWMRDCVAVRFEGRQRRGEGTRFVARTRVLGITLDDKMEVVSWKPRRRMGVRHSGIVTGTGEFRLRRAGLSSSRFCWIEDLSFPWYMGGPVGALVAVPVLRRIWKGSLNELKRRLEAGA
jgi:hypothetical protein